MAITSIKTGSSFTNLIKYNDFLGPNPGYDPAATFLIQRIAGTGSSGTITFNSIPQNYKHLQIRGLYIDSSGSDDRQNMLVKFNGDTSSTPPAHFLRGRSDGVAAYSDFRTSGNFVLWYSGYASPSQSNLIGGVQIIDIHDYTSTTKNKTVRSLTGVENNNFTSDGSGIVLNSALWENTAAITSITLTSHGGNFRTNSTFALYGMVG
jgi:hypothetical protein